MQINWDGRMTRMLHISKSEYNYTLTFMNCSNPLQPYHLYVLFGGGGVGWVVAILIVASCYKSRVKLHLGSNAILPTLFSSKLLSEIIRRSNMSVFVPFRYLRSSILSAACSSGDPDALGNATKMFKEWKSGQV